MKKNNIFKGIVKLVAAGAALLFMTVPAHAEGLNGVYESSQGVWSYYRDGVVDTGYTGLAQNEYGWWYVKDGVVDFTHTGYVEYDGKEWCVSGGTINFDIFDILPWDNKWYKVYNGYWDKTYTGLAENDYGWWYVKDGVVDFTHTGYVEYNGKEWCVSGGTINFDIFDILPWDNKWYKVYNGYWDKTYTGLAQNEYGWWYVKNGLVDFTYTGLAGNDSGTWYVENGEVRFDVSGTVTVDGKIYKCDGGLCDVNYTGIVLYNDKWMYLNNNKIDTSFTGIVSNDAGEWYVSNGEVSFDYTGKINYQDKVYHVTNGLVDGYTDFTGVKLVGNQRLYYNEGVFDKSYNGNAKDQDGLQWRVKDGVVVGSVGMDVSNHNGNIDWDAVKADGIQFAIIRLGWGDDVENQDDALAARNISECERIGMPYGLYIYSYALKVEEAQSEVSHSLRFANSCNPTLGVWFDMEDADGYKERHGINVYEERQLLTDFCKIFCDAVSAAGYKTGIYANYNYFKNVLLSDQLQSYDKWLAHWGIDEPSIPCEMWQYTSDGSADGISGRLDMNIWYH